MNESKELKAGDSCEFRAGGQVLLLEPIPYGRLKKVLKLAMDAINDIAKGKDLDKDQAAQVIPEKLIDHASAVIPMLFDPNKHSFLNQEWMEENLTIPLIKEIFKKAIVINDLTDFFGQVGLPKPVLVTPEAKSESPIPTTR